MCILVTGVLALRQCFHPCLKLIHDGKAQIPCANLEPVQSAATDHKTDDIALLHPI